MAMILYYIESDCKRLIDAIMASSFSTTWVGASLVVEIRCKVLDKENLPYPFIRRGGNEVAHWVVSSQMCASLRNLSTVNLRKFWCPSSRRICARLVLVRNLLTRVLIFCCFNSLAYCFLFLFYF